MEPHEVADESHLLRSLERRRAHQESLVERVEPVAPPRGHESLLGVGSTHAPVALVHDEQLAFAVSENAGHVPAGLVVVPLVPTDHELLGIHHVDDAVPAPHALDDVPPLRHGDLRAYH